MDLDTATSSALTPSQPGTAPTVMTPDMLHTGYSDPLRDVTRFLTAVAQTAPGQDFRQVWSQVGSASTTDQMNGVIEQMYKLSPAHLASVLSSTDAPTRAYFHTQALRLAEGVHNDMTEFSQTAMVLRWLMMQGLPAIAHLPEEAVMGTTTELRRHYGAVDSACRVARPDDTNPTCIQLSENCQISAKTIAAHETTNKALQKKNKTLMTLVGVGFGLLGLVLVLCIVYVCVRSGRSGHSSGPSGQSGPAGKSSISNTAAMVSNSSNWGFGPVRPSDF